MTATTMLKRSVMPQLYIGPLIRERRKTLGVTQAKLAADIGISASYMNLIEANKRQVGGRLLQKLAQALDVEMESLGGAAEQRLAVHLREMATDPLLQDLQITTESVDELVGRYPEWARAMVATYRSLQDQTQIAAALSDRLNHDPFLGDAVHGMLTHVTAIRSAAEIVETVEDLETAQRTRFDQMIAKESRRLADVTTKLAAYFDSTNAPTRQLTPSEEVDDFLSERGNYFPKLEEAARSGMCGQRQGYPADETMLIEALKRDHGLRTEIRAAADLDLTVLRNDSYLDEASKTFILLDTTTATTRRFQIARLYMEKAIPDVIDAELDRTETLTTPAAKETAAAALSSYAAAAMIMAYEPFQAYAAQCRYDVELLAHRFGVSFEQACHRLTTLRRPDAAGVPFAFMRSDPAGFITKRFALPRLPIPRYGNACPLWAVYSAFQTTGVINRQFVEMPAGDRFLFIARATVKNQAVFQQQRQVVSVMLACDAIHADKTVYADGLDLSASDLATPIGPTCRLCPRQSCRYREEEPILAS